MNKSLDINSRLSQKYPHGIHQKNNSPIVGHASKCTHERRIGTAQDQSRPEHFEGVFWNGCQPMEGTSLAKSPRQLAPERHIHQIKGTLVQKVRPRVHSVVHRFKHASFQAGTWCMFVHTPLWHASVQASVAAAQEAHDDNAIEAP